MPTASRIDAVQHLAINYLLAFPVFSLPRRARWSLKRGGDQREVSQRLGPVLSDLLLQEHCTALELFDAVDSIFDTDPSVKTNSLQFTKDSIVVV